MALLVMTKVITYYVNLNSMHNMVCYMCAIGGAPGPYTLLIGAPSIPFPLKQFRRRVTQDVTQTPKPHTTCTTSDCFFDLIIESA
jgi:hypothetical protein